MIPFSEDATIGMAIAPVAFILGGIITFLWLYKWAHHPRTPSHRTLDDTFAHALMKLVKTHPEVKVALTGDFQCSNQQLILEALSFNRFYHGVQSCRTIDNDVWRMELFYTALLRNKDDPCRAGVLLSTLTDVFVSLLNNYCDSSFHEEGGIMRVPDFNPFKLKLE